MEQRVAHHRRVEFHQRGLWIQPVGISRWFGRVVFVPCGAVVGKVTGAVATGRVPGWFPAASARDSALGGGAASHAKPRTVKPRRELFRPRAPEENRSTAAAAPSANEWRHGGTRGRGLSFFIRFSLQIVDCNAMHLYYYCYIEAPSSGRQQGQSGNWVCLVVGWLLIARVCEWVGFAAGRFCTRRPSTLSSSSN